jgi:hypothetical protein
MRMSLRSRVHIDVVPSSVVIEKPTVRTKVLFERPPIHVFTPAYFLINFRSQHGSGIVSPIKGRGDSVYLSVDNSSPTGGGDKHQKNRLFQVFHNSRPRKKQRTSA